MFTAWAAAPCATTASPPARVKCMTCTACRRFWLTARKRGYALWEYVREREPAETWEHLHQVWKAMQAAIQRGLKAEGVLPGSLGLARKAWAFYRKARLAGAHLQRPGFLSAYALAVAEENASGGVIVTAPTCGSSGVLPAVLKYLQDIVNCSDESDPARPGNRGFDWQPGKIQRLHLGGRGGLPGRGGRGLRHGGWGGRAADGRHPAPGGIRRRDGAGAYPGPHL